MPGRQSTGATSYAKPKAKGRKKNRSLNALAIAEKKIPTQSRLPIDRADEFKRHTAKRQRGREGGDSENEGEMRRGKKRKGAHEDSNKDHIEHGSDSDGNAWVVGQVNRKDDSELDSDEAFGDSDEEKFEGFILRGSSAVKPKIKLPSKSKSAALSEDGSEDIDLHEDGDSIETSEQSDGLGDDAVDLATMLDDNDEHSNEGAGAMIRDEEGHNDRQPGMQGSFFGNRKSTESDEASIFTNSDTEDDQPSFTQLESLQKLVSNIDSTKSSILPRSNGIINAEESMAPSQFGISSTRKLTVADLIPSITDSNLRKSLKLLMDNNESKVSSKSSGIPKKLDAPLPKRQQDRLNRAAAYDKSKETLNRWIDTVKYNRRAEHLAFPLQDPNAVVAPGAQKLLPLIHSQPVTELEGVIQNILQDSGLVHRSQGSEEDQVEVVDGLQTNKISVQEVQARRAELRKARELLFREEIRSRRIKKIKSKSYRRVHRKEREKLAQQEKIALSAAGVEDPESEQERMDRRRAEERVGARHRESKWAKSVKDSGRAAWDEDARGGIVEAARRGDELTKRIQGRDFHIDESSLGSSESESDVVATDELVDQTQASVKKFRDRVKRLDNHSEKLEWSNVEPKSGLSSMKFMKKADALRKERNDADLDNLRREAAGKDTLSEEESESGQGRRHFGPKTTQKKLSTSREKEFRSEFEERDGILSGDESQENSQGKDQQISIDALPIPGAQNFQTRARTAQESKIGKRGEDNNARSNTVDNPWLSGFKGLRREELQRGHSQADAIISNSLGAEGPVGQMIGRKAQQALKITRRTGKPQIARQKLEARILDEVFDSESEDEEGSSMLPVMRDQELIRKAFAGDEVVADFDKEKRNITRDEEEHVIDNSLPGWGNWTGAGISKREQKRNKGKFLSKVDGIQKDKRKDARLDRVIINEKRVLKVCLLQTVRASSANYCRMSSTSHQPYPILLKLGSSTKGPFGSPWALSGRRKRHFSLPLNPGF